jgi:hypothetical protein
MSNTIVRYTVNAGRSGHCCIVPVGRSPSRLQCPRMISHVTVMGRYLSATTGAADTPDVPEVRSAPEVAVWSLEDPLPGGGVAVSRASVGTLEHAEDDGLPSYF